MYELDDKQKIALAKILMNKFNTGDWIELFTSTNCKDFLDDCGDRFITDVTYSNESLKEGCIEAVNHILNKSPENIEKIWDFPKPNFKNIIKHENTELFNILSSMLDNIPSVEFIIPKNANDTMLDALDDAKILLDSKGATNAFDRVHTAFQSYLRDVCDAQNIQYNKTDKIGALLKNIKNDLSKQNISNQNVINILNAVGNIVGNFDTIRNNHSLAHGNSDLLSKPDAQYCIDIIQSTIKYLENILNN